MALSQPRSQANRASKHMRVASVTPANRAASVTAGMQPRNLELLHRAHEREQAERGEQAQKAPPLKGVLRTIKPITSGVASVGPRMVKFRSNIQYLGEKVSVMCLRCVTSKLLCVVLNHSFLHCILEISAHQLYSIRKEGLCNGCQLKLCQQCMQSKVLQWKSASRWTSNACGAGGSGDP